MGWTLTVRRLAVGLALWTAGCATSADDPVDAGRDMRAAPERDAVPAADAASERDAAPELDASEPDAARELDASEPDAARELDAAREPDASEPDAEPDASEPDAEPDAAEPDAAAAPVLPTRRVDGLPRVHDFSGAPPDHVDRLVQRAIEGLGLDARTGPEPRDRVFVGRWYLAWIDETGFYGKINGLWPLNGDPDALDFTLLDGDRPVNVFVVGEHGDGAWPGGYMGAEHIEFPNAVPEADDDPGCSGPNNFCAQYSHGEAHRYTDPDIPAWRACNEGSPRWDAHFGPYEVLPTDTGLRLMYEGPLTKQGDFGGSTDGDNCHADFLFDDGQRRRVFLRVGYALDADAHFVDRLLQVRNPEGNPVFDGPFSFIGGYVMTEWPDAHPLKRLNRHARVDDAAVEVRWGADRVRIEPGRWTPLPASVPGHDVVLGWARQPVSLSAFDDYVNGRAFTLSNHGDDAGDSGFCLCVVHGAIEMGGGLISVPVPGGTTSHLARRRLTIHHEVPVPQPNIWTYEAERDLQHAVGRVDADGWAAATEPDAAGHLAFGPYARDWGEGPRSATFRLMVDVADDRDERVVTLDVYDADAGEVLTTRDILRSAFGAAFTYRDFTLDFDTVGRDGHAMETRVYWHDNSYVRLDRVVVRER